MTRPPTPAESRAIAAQALASGALLPPGPPNKGGRPRKVAFVVAPACSPTLKTTPGPKQGVEYKSPYRHLAGRDHAP